LRLQDWALAWGAFIPGRFAMDGDVNGAPLWLTPLTATLVHGNILHLGFNLLILVFCGRPTEAVVGPGGIAILYLVGAYVAAAAHYLVDPSDMMPMIGASGAISAVLGAYAILFGRNRVKVANSSVAMWLNALWLMAAWVGLQLIMGFSLSAEGVNIAIAAHIGGFLIGVILANPLLLLRYRKA
jgi:membrane associated rhomboid family serine protease